MTTFLPLPSFAGSAAVLDPVRRWKQAVECRALVRALGQGPLCLWRRPAGDDPGGYVYGPVRPRPGHDVRVTPNYNHPACVMWRGFTHALMWYHNEVLAAVRAAGTHRVTAFGPYDLRGPGVPEVVPLPPWMGDPALHRSHRRVLLSKDPAFYSRYGWAEAPLYEYVWPPDPTVTKESARGS